MRKRNRKKLRWLLLVPGLAVILGGVWIARVLSANGGLVKSYEVWHDPKGLFPEVHRMIILVAGKDYNHDSHDIASTKNSRSDTIMLLSADLDHATLAAVGVPRDTRVTAPDGKTGKINGTFARGGIKLLSETIGEMFGIHPDHYVVLKADAVKSIVDALGGVEVEVRDRMFYEDSWDDLKIDLPAGKYRVNGEQAAGFVRFRESGNHKYGPNKEYIAVPKIASKEEGDIRRMQRQQQLVHSMLAEVTKPGNILRWPEIIHTAFSQVETDLSVDQLEALANIFKNSPRTGLGGATIPGKDATIGGTYYWQADVDRAKLMLSWILNGDPEAGRKLTRVVVYGTHSEAQDYADRLKQAGFSARAARPLHSTATDSEVVYHSEAFEGMAHDIASQLGISNVRKEVVQAGAFWLPEVKVNLTSPTAGEIPGGRA